MDLKHKRTFDIIFSIFSFPIWFILSLIIIIFLFLSGYNPVFFSQKRIIAIGKEKRIFKFRSMNPDKVKKYYKSDISKKEQQTGFISIDPSSGVYTKRGSFMEAFKLVELPEMFHVFIGDLSIVGNRPLPKKLQEQLEENYHIASQRLLTKAGVFGVIQMAGRQNFKSLDRIKLEVHYSKLQQENYSPKRDLIIISISLLRIFGLRIVNNPETIYKILNDNSLSKVGRLIAIKIKASRPTKK